MSEEFESSVADIAMDGPGEAGGNGDVSQPSPSSDPAQSEPVPSGPIKYGEPEPQRPPQPRVNGQFAARPRPPNSWRADVAERHWSKLDPELQSYVNQRETEAQRAISEYGSRIKNYEPFDQIAQEFAEDLRLAGVQNPADGYRALLQAERFIRSNPLQGIMQIAQAYGVDLHAELGRQIQPQAYQAAHQHYQQIEQQRALTETNALVERFKETHPHFESVENEMTALLPGLRQANPGASHTEILSKAYDAATHANPEVRKHVIAESRKAEIEKQKAAEVQRLNDARQKAVEAKVAAKLNVRSSFDMRPNPRTFDQTIEDIARRRYG